VILVTRFNGSQFYINPELIQSIEATPDTVITLLNSSKVIVKEPPQVLVERIIEYRRKILDGPANQSLGE
jgi:flagellar protein FlbD